MKRFFAILVAISLGLGGAAAQEAAPFDMSPENPRDQPSMPLPRMPATPVPVAPAPNMTPPTPPLPEARKPEPPKPQPAPQAKELRRYVVPFSELSLTGETDRKSWTVKLTPEQAAASTVFHLGYENAVVVAPEYSRLRVMLNNVKIVDEPIRSSDHLSELNVNLPPGLLVAGTNEISIDATMRHRTDCSIRSTYDLWTRIDPAQTYFTFTGTTAGRLSRLEDIAAIGVDPSGVTRFNIVVPAIDTALTISPVFKLAEGLALASGMPNQAIQISKTPTPPEPGKLTIFVGTPTELSRVMHTAPQAAQSPFASFVGDPASGTSALVVSGPTWQAIGVAVGTIVEPFDRAADVVRTALSTQNWSSPDAPLFTQATRMPLSEMGVNTQEFAGRRFQTEFNFGIPSDFYANGYGTARILLDAAYSPQILPGSHIDIYVNGNIASTMPITDTDGAILHHYPVKVTMRHFRPGVNTMKIEAVLLTAADNVCTPGTTGSKDPRFVLFDTSELSVPDFARIARIPELGETAGTGFPYNRADTPLSLFVDQSQPAYLSAAATMLARMSVAAGKTIPVEVTASITNNTDGDALFVGRLSDIQPQILKVFNIDEDSRLRWGNRKKGLLPEAEHAETVQTLKRWRQQVSGHGFGLLKSDLEGWLNRNFDISSQSLGLGIGKEPAYVPPSDTTLLVAQQAGPNGHGTWTLVAAPSGDLLQAGMDKLVSRQRWSEMAGRISALTLSGAVRTTPDPHVIYVQTQPSSFVNYRLIATNWLSSNPLFYGMLLFIGCILLALATEAFLSLLGRRSG